MDKPHRKLEVWKRSVELVTKIYGVTATFPPEERFCLANQMRRCALSIPSNLAEGAARKGNKEWVQFIHMAMGSSSELDTHLEISRRLSMISNEDWKKLDAELEKIDRMLVGLRDHALRHRNHSAEVPK